MTTFILAIIIFLEFIFYIIVADVILSWLAIAGVQIRPKFIASVLGPIYGFIKRNIPTTFGAFDFTPIIVIFGVTFLKGLLLMNFPEVNALLNQISL